MKSIDFLKEGFVEDANEAHQDHEVQMARQECFHSAEHALALHKLLRNISEAQGLEGWVSSKITLANDYLKSVREYLEYELLTKDINDVAPTMTIAEEQELKKKNQIVEYKVLGAELGSENYTINNIELNALQNVASNYYDRPVKIAQSKDNPDLYTINVDMTVGPVDYGSYNAATRTASIAKRITDKGDQLQKVLQGISEGVAEGTRQQLDFDSLYGKVFKITDNNGNPNNPGFSIVTPLNGDSWNWKERPEFKKIVKQKLNDPNFLGDYKYQQIIDAMLGNKFDSSKHVDKGVAEGSYGKVEEMSAGSVATVINPPAKNKSKVGTLFGGTYKQKQVKEGKQMTSPVKNTKQLQHPAEQIQATGKINNTNSFNHRLISTE